MKRLITLVLVATLALTGCSNVQDYVKVEYDEQLETVEATGTVENRKIEEEAHFIINVDGEKEEYTYADLEEAEHISIEDVLTFVYDTDHNIVEIKDIKVAEEEEEATPEPAEPAIVSETITPSDIDLEDFIQFNTIPVEGFDGTDIIEIATYIDAEQVGDDILRDDNDRFIIVAKGEENYVLMDRMVNMASINVDVYFSDDVFNVTILASDTASIDFSKYVYTGESFEKSVIFTESGNINLLGSF